MRTLCGCGCGGIPNRGAKYIKGHYKRTKESRKKQSNVNKYTFKDIWRQIDIRNEDDCWEWVGHKDKNGYGRATINRKDYRSHRIVYKETYGTIPEGLFILHTCNNPSCCNPNHLYTGTNQDNMDQMVADGRSPHLIGEKSGTHKLKEKDVLEIRQLYSTGEYTQRDLSKKYGISQTEISRIYHRTRWDHV